MKLQGERIELTLSTEQDLDFLCRMECDKDLWHFEESVPSVEEARENCLEKFAVNEDEEGSSYDFVVRLASDQTATPIGIAQIWSYVDGRKSWEIGFAILPEYGGHGYGREAAELLLALAFNKFGAHKVVGMCNAHNHRSSALMEHIGMRREGVFKEELYWNGCWTDQYFYSILDSEYAAQAKFGMMYRSFFVSQHDQDYHPEVACGVASLLMLLRYHQLADEVTFLPLAQELRLTDPPAIKGYQATDPPIGVYPEDVYRFLLDRKILFRVSFFKHEWETCLLSGPIMVLMRDDGDEFEPHGHWVVVVDKEGPVFTYLDPWYKGDSGEYVRQIEESAFFECFTGCACQIIQKGHGVTKFIPVSEGERQL